MFKLKQKIVSDEKVNRFIDTYFLPSVYEDKKIVEDQFNFFLKNNTFDLKEHFSIFEKRINLFRKNIV